MEKVGHASCVFNPHCITVCLNVFFSQVRLAATGRCMLIFRVYRETVIIYVYCLSISNFNHRRAGSHPRRTGTNWPILCWRAVKHPPSNPFPFFCRIVKSYFSTTRVQEAVWHYWASSGLIRSVYNFHSNLLWTAFDLESLLRVERVGNIVSLSYSLSIVK